MGAASTPARICPECGSRNSGLSLFCAECGASLTSATAASADDSQTTTVFRPVTGTSADDPHTTQQFQPQPALASTATNTGAVSSYRLDERPAESRRGLVLGWIAGILILLVIAWLGWTSYLDTDTRDSIIGWFS